MKIPIQKSWCRVRKVQVSAKYLSPKVMWENNVGKGCPKPPALFGDNASAPEARKLGHKTRKFFTHRTINSVLP